MKRKYSKLTFHRKMKRGIATCLDLSEKCFFDCSNSLSTHTSNISESHITVAKNLKDSQIINDEIDVSYNSDHLIHMI